ncbi:hypothetical protein ACB092_03G080300 [Castanea dentata]
MAIEFNKTQSQQVVSSILSSIPRGFKASILFKNGKSAYEDIFRGEKRKQERERERRGVRERME